jgi:hypothetical protein
MDAPLFHLQFILEKIDQLSTNEQIKRVVLNTGASRCILVDNKVNVYASKYRLAPI